MPCRIGRPVAPIGLDAVRPPSRHGGRPAAARPPDEKSCILPTALLADRRSSHVETRPYLIVGGLLANLFAGALVGAACALIFGPAWNMGIAMLAGMGLGMLIALPVSFLFGALFGAMEVMLPVMLTGMFTSMVVAMRATMEPIAWLEAAKTGSWLGLMSVGACYAANAILRRRKSPWI